MTSETDYSGSDLIITEQTAVEVYPNADDAIVIRALSQDPHDQDNVVVQPHYLPALINRVHQLSSQADA